MSTTLETDICILGGGIAGGCIGLGINYYRRSEHCREHAPSWSTTMVEKTPAEQFVELKAVADGGKARGKDGALLIGVELANMQAAAMLSVGMCYHLGDKTEQDVVEAMKYFQLAADKEDLNGLYCLAIYYMTGTGIEKDEAKGLALFTEAAEKGNAKAQLQLAKCHREGLGTKASPDEALRWLERAADAGSPEAQTHLGHYYDTGTGGVKQDEAEAIRCYKLAAEQGHSVALMNLGSCYFRGAAGAAPDKPAAIQYWAEAANGGSMEAMFVLGQCFLEGEGQLDGKPDPVKAKMWFEQASAMGNPEAMMQLQMMAHENSESQEAKHPELNVGPAVVARMVLAPGDGKRFPKQGDTLTMHYTGKLADGTIFDSSKDRGPLSFVIGVGQVIACVQSDSLQAPQFLRGRACYCLCRARAPPDFACGAANILVRTAGGIRA